MTRDEKVAEAQRLRAEGLLLREIAERMGVAVTTVDTWLSDPDLAKQRARREGYAGTCVDCGKPTDGSRGYRPPKRCESCTNARRREAARERIIYEVRRFAAMYGRPPAAHDWNPGLAQQTCSPAHAADVARRYVADGWPPASGVQRLFGSWSAGIEAAGLEPRGVGVRGPAWSPTHDRHAA